MRCGGNRYTRPAVSGLGNLGPKCASGRSVFPVAGSSPATSTIQNLIRMWFLILLASCQAPSSPTPPPNSDQSPSTVAAVPPSPESAVGAGPSVATETPDGAVADCDVVNPRQAGVEFYAIGEMVHGYVPAEPTCGAGYVKVWTPDRHGTLVGTFPVNQRFGFRASPGVHTFRLDVETKCDRVYQCDRLKFTLEIKRPTTTTTVPPTTTTTSTPPTTTTTTIGCELEPACEATIERFKPWRQDGVWILVRYSCQDTSSRVTLRADGEVVRSKVCSAECEKKKGHFWFDKKGSHWATPEYEVACEPLE